jgi:hypothetical protein
MVLITIVRSIRFTNRRAEIACSGEDFLGCCLNGRTVGVDSFLFT